MPNLMTDFEHLKAIDTLRLMERRETLKASAPPESLSDESLIELLAIARILRTRTVAPKVSGAGKKVPANLDAL